MKDLVLLLIIIFSLGQANAQYWNEVQKIVASDRGESDMFGWSVSIGGDHAIVGAIVDRDNASGGVPLIEAGSAYIFARDGDGNWNEVQKIVASDREGDEWFGNSVAINDNYAIVGAPLEGDGFNGGPGNFGAVYVFEDPTVTGIKENRFASSINVYPNPTSKTLTIDLGQNFHQVEAIVRNIYGQIIHRETYNSIKIFRLEIEAVPGIYLVEIYSSRGDFTSLKFLKQ